MLARRQLASSNTPAGAAYGAYISKNGGSTPSVFSFASDAIVRSTFDALWNDYYKGQVLRYFPTLANDSSFLTSKEMLVIASSVWNGGSGLVGSGTQFSRDIVTGNRAAAWFELRYNSNGGANPGAGLAKRRYFESQTFGLWDSPNGPASLSEALQAYDTLTKKRSAIFAYEQQYGYLPDGTPGDQHAKGFDAAARDYASLIGGSVGLAAPQKLLDLFAPAEALLFAQLQTQFAGSTEILSALNTNSFNPTNVYTGVAQQSVIVRTYAGAAPNGSLLYAGTGNETLVGGTASDLLIAGTGNDSLNGGTTGNDTLVGGRGSDTLRGGSGTNTFVFVPVAATGIADAPNTESISTQSGKGSVYINGVATALGSALVPLDGERYKWTEKLASAR